MRKAAVNLGVKLFQPRSQGSRKTFPPDHCAARRRAGL